MSQGQSERQGDGNQHSEGSHSASRAHMLVSPPPGRSHRDRKRVVEWTSLPRLRSSANLKQHVLHVSSTPFKRLGFVLLTLESPSPSQAISEPSFLFLPPPEAAPFCRLEFKASPSQSVVPNPLPTEQCRKRCTISHRDQVPPTALSKGRMFVSPSPGFWTVSFCKYILCPPPPPPNCGMHALWAAKHGAVEHESR